MYVIINSVFIYPVSIFLSSYLVISIYLFIYLSVILHLSIYLFVYCLFIHVQLLSITYIYLTLFIISFDHNAYVFSLFVLKRIGEDFSYAIRRQG